MTAEVIVMNKTAVALAADSAVTIGDEAEGKIWNSVNKLFTLSKYHPVGVLIFSSADYMGVPFETVTKMYREKLGTDSEATVEAYATKFAKYFANDLFTSESQQRANVRRTWQVVFDELLSGIREDVREEFRRNGECSTERRREIVDLHGREHLAMLEACNVEVGFAKMDPIAIVKQYEKEYDAVIRDVFGAGNKDLNKKVLERVAGLSVTKNHDYSTYTGVVVAGFGNKEVFPHYVVMRIHGIYAGILKAVMVDKDGIDHDGSHSLIVPFAQSEMVGRFMEGVDNSYENYVRGSTVEALRELAKGIIDVHVPGSDEEKKKIREEVDKSLTQQAGQLGESADKWRRRKFVDQILEVVVSLPKEELANLAEALVNLTSIKRRMSSERETVGGPIDVAVISKGDGFIWIRRKHYFLKELNPQFFENYWRSS
jgi:hypothetical protein